MRSMPIIYKCKNCHSVLYYIDETTRLFTGPLSFKDVARLYKYKCPNCNAVLGDSYTITFDLIAFKPKKKIKVENEKYIVVTFRPTPFFAQNSDLIYAKFDSTLSTFAQDAIEYCYKHNILIQYVEPLHVVKSVRIRSSYYKKLNELARKHNKEISTTLRFVLDYYLQLQLQS